MNKARYVSRTKYRWKKIYPKNTNHAVLFFTSHRYTPLNLVSVWPISLKIQHLQNDLLDDMLTHIHMPPEFLDGVVHDALAQMTSRFQSIPSLSTGRRDAGTRPLGYRIGVMVNVRDGYWREEGCGIPDGRWEGEVQATRCHSFARCFECDRWQSKGGAKEGSETPSETMANEPYVCERV